MPWCYVLYLSNIPLTDLEMVYAYIERTCIRLLIKISKKLKRNTQKMINCLAMELHKTMHNVHNNIRTNALN